MTDDALKRAYRLLTAGRLTAETIGADALAALANADYAEAERDAHLAVVAESAQNADLLRVLRALANDAAVLSSDIQQLHGPSRARPAHAPRPASRPARWYAIAASVALVGVVGLLMQATVVSVEAVPDEQTVASAAVAALSAEPTHASPAGDLAASGKIMMASFEGVPASGGHETSKPTIFVGDFDS